MAIFQQGVFSIGGGGASGKPVPLLSITTAPSAPFEKGSKYYDGDSNSETYQKILTAVEDDTWENAKVSNPSWGTYYLYDGHAYVWDGNSLEYFELNDYQQTKDKTDSYTSNSKTTYPNSYALKEGLARKQDTLVSGTNIKTINDNSILGSGNLAIETHQDFPADWTTDGTFAEFLTDIFNDESAVPGMSYLGTLRCSAGLPESFNNVEAVIEVQQGPNSKTLHVTITSGNVAPYRWEYTSWNSGHSNSGWISFQLPLTAGTNIDITNNVISATDTTYTAGAGIAINGTTISATDALPVQTDNSGKVLTTDGTNTSWQYAAHFISGNTQNDVEIGFSSSYEIDWDNLQVGDRLDKATYVGTFNAEDPNAPTQSYAIFVLDAAYRGKRTWGDIEGSILSYEQPIPLPVYSTGQDALDATESATWNGNTMYGYYSTSQLENSAFDFCRNNSVSVNGVSYNAQLPNLKELDIIAGDNTAFRQLLDSFDPTVSEYPNNSLENWNIEGTSDNYVLSSDASVDDYGRRIWTLQISSGNKNFGNPRVRTDAYGVIPIFEIPIPIPTTRYTNVNRLKVKGVIYQIQDKSQFNVVTDVTSDTDPALALTDNTYYTFSDAITSLTISSIPVVNLGPIEILFTADTGFAGVTFPQGTLYTGTIPTWEAGKTYLISIQRGIVVAAEIKTME